MRFFIILVSLQFLTVNLYGFEAHEWGTFTSLVGSDGKTQDGMYHEDEPLPDFVHAFGETQLDIAPPPVPPGDCPPFSKVCFFSGVLDNNFISQKMETPVIYFYGNERKTVQVDVEFPEGIITDTFPAPISSSPKNSPDLVVGNGKAQFLVELLPETDLVPPTVEPGNIYGHARMVDSLMLRIYDEVEKFIFYRGLGRFNPQLKMQSVEGSFAFSALAKDRPLAAFLVYKAPGYKPHMLPVIDQNQRSLFESVSNGVHNFNVPEADINNLKYGSGNNILAGGDPYEVLNQALIKSGLHPDEARAMVNTWENGYFQTPGLRLLYILPKDEVDQVLPLKMTPAPANLERVFVARIEILLQKDEFDLVAKIIAEKENFVVESLGRLAEPQLRRAREIYIEQHLLFEPDIPNFEYGLFTLFDELVEKSRLLSTTIPNAH